jgi:hypothetical protein
MGDSYALRSSGGLLLSAAERGEVAPIAWAQVDLGGGLVITVSTDALKASIPEVDRPIRLPVSYRETIAVCRLLGCLPPTQAMSDAVWHAAPQRVVPVALVRTQADTNFMTTVAWSIRHNAAIDTVERDPGTLVADVGKDWILDNGIAVRGAVNYGWRMPPTGWRLQSQGHDHDDQHWDYSQVLRVVQRDAFLNSEKVDLLDVLAGSIEARFVDALR